METTLTQEQIDNNYATFIDILTTNVKRDGMELLLKWLNKSDFKTAPASTRFHSSFDGGLVSHSLNVYDRLVELTKNEYGSIEQAPYTLESLVIVSLLHDISKADYYVTQLRNNKNEKTGVWEKVPYRTVRDISEQFVYGGHAENSVEMLTLLDFKLTREERRAIRHHMAGQDYTEDLKDIGRVSGQIFNESKLSLLLHIADMMATFIDESKHDK